MWNRLFAAITIGATVLWLLWRSSGDPETTITAALVELFLVMALIPSHTKLTVSEDEVRVRGGRETYVFPYNRLWTVDIAKGRWSEISQTDVSGFNNVIATTAGGEEIERPWLPIRPPLKDSDDLDRDPLRKNGNGVILRFIDRTQPVFLWTESPQALAAAITPLVERRKAEGIPDYLPPQRKLSQE